MIDERISCLDWQRQALCFPAEEASPWDADRLGEMASLAKEGCARCPVFDLCRERVDALEGKANSNSLSCVYAGETPGERVKRRRRVSQRVVEEGRQVKSEIAEEAEVKHEEYQAGGQEEQAAVEVGAKAEPTLEDIAEHLERVERLLLDFCAASGALRLPAGFEAPPAGRCCLCRRPFAQFVSDLEAGLPMHIASGHCEPCYRDYLDLQKAIVKHGQFTEAA